MATIGIHYVNAAIQGAAKHGLDTSQLLADAGIRASLTQQPDARVHSDNMTRLVQNIWQAMDDEFMGFVNTRCKNGVFALMASTVSHCTTLAALLRSGTHFYNLFCDGIETILDEGDELATLSIRFAEPELDPQHFYREFLAGDMASFFQLVHWREHPPESR